MTASKKPLPESQSPVRRARNAGRLKELILYVRAGGRCEFDGCNKYLLRNPLTLTQANFGKKAHIVAFKESGARGRQGRRPKDINALSNLMLLCPTCHDEVDKHPDKYPRRSLERYKAAHEKRIELVTAAGPDRKTTIVQFKARIGGKQVAIPAPDVFAAVAPRFPEDEQGLVIDCSAFDDRSPHFIEQAVAEIDRRIDSLLEPRMQGEPPRHISLFAFGPIPLLVHLGSKLSDKLPVDFFQFHRDTKSWAWKVQGETAHYTHSKLRGGTDPTRVALILSLSGKIAATDLPLEVDETFSVYELTLEDQTPNTMFLNTRADLTAFRVAYQRLLGEILAGHGMLDTMYLFPAIPLPIAALCGHDLLNKTHPSLWVYDHDKAKIGFTYQLSLSREFDGGIPAFNPSSVREEAVLPSTIVTPAQSLVSLVLDPSEYQA